MSELTIVVPTRGRPENMLRLARAFAETCTAGTQLYFVMDQGDPAALQFEKMYQVATAYSPRTHIAQFQNSGMVDALNNGARHIRTKYIGFMGDDHLPRTVGWDQRYIESLDNGNVIVWGDDLLQGENFPTQVAMPTKVVDALGWMAPPQFHHLCIDLVWKDWGLATSYEYLPDVIVEHLHPANGKATLDEGYLRVNSIEVCSSDSAKYYDYRDNGGLATDVAKLKEAGL